MTPNFTVARTIFDDEENTVSKILIVSIYFLILLKSNLNYFKNKPKDHFFSLISGTARGSPIPLPPPWNTYFVRCSAVFFLRRSGSRRTLPPDGLWRLTSEAVLNSSHSRGAGVASSWTSCKLHGPSQRRQRPYLHLGLPWWGPDGELGSEDNLLGRRRGRARRRQDGIFLFAL